jgi:D-alanyl-D-alanine carboxypeptidase
MPQKQYLPQNPQRRRQKKHRFAVLIFCILFALLFASVWFITNHILTENSPEIPTAPFIQNNNPAANSPNIPQTTFQILTFAQLAEISNDFLLLVNTNYAAPANISGEPAKVTDYARTLNPELLMNSDALLMLREMFASAEKAGHNQFRVTEGYRTQERQQSLYDTATDKSLVALPGHSEHQTGLAADISYHGVNIGNSIQGTWLMDNSYKYGFILRYPQHKTHITGFPFEPWHYRFVGQPHAWYMRQNDLVLEEYIDYLKERGEITIIHDRIEYWVYYLSCDTETLEIPENSSYTASSDNIGGIIVTVRR